MAFAAHGIFCRAADEISEMTPPDQHQREIQKNLRSWESKPLLQQIYRSFYQRIIGLIDTNAPGPVVEIGSGIGNLKAHLPRALASDLFANPWLDVVCDGYELPFADGSLSHIVMFDVFHHLRAPNVFFREARRALTPSGRLILFEPYISIFSRPVYGLFHHEPVAWSQAIERAESLPRPRDYYAAQGNATRLFFCGEYSGGPAGWNIFHAEAFSSFSYLFSGGYSKPAVYPAGALRYLQWCDEKLSRWPRIFGARCLIGLRPSA
jgi:SAM-dependent methyltransferase